MDTRTKIQLGGLVILAGLGEEDSAVILGILATAAAEIAGPAGINARERFRQSGDQAFKARQTEVLLQRIRDG